MILIHLTVLTHLRSSDSPSNDSTQKSFSNCENQLTLYIRTKSIFFDDSIDASCDSLLSSNRPKDVQQYSRRREEGSAAFTVFSKS